MMKRTFTPSENRVLSEEQKAYLMTRPDMVSLQPNSMLLPTEQLYQSRCYGAVTVDRAMELDSMRAGMAAQIQRPVTATPAYDNYTAEEERFIDRHGISSGLY